MSRAGPRVDASSVRGQICARASAYFDTGDRFGRHFARFKMKSDPLFTDVLLTGALSGCRDLIDLGCGQGLLTAWLLAARIQRRLGLWPSDWPEPPTPDRIRGVDIRAASIERARDALGERADFQVRDIREADCSGADAVAILDVLHFIDFAEQQYLLRRIRESLPAHGVLILRIANAGSGIAYHAGRWVDRINDLVRDGRIPHLSCRSESDWLELLRRCGYRACSQERRSGRSFANTLLVAHAS